MNTLRRAVLLLVAWLLAAAGLGHQSMAANQAPRVTVGPASLRIVALGAPVDFTAAVQDDGLPEPASLSPQWSTAGPAAAAYLNAHTLTPTLTFSVAGSYTVQCVVSDGALTGRGTTVVQVVDLAEGTSLELSRAPEEPTGSGTTVFRNRLDGPFSASFNGGLIFRYQSTSAAEDFYFYLAAPLQGPLRAGRYDLTNRWSAAIPVTEPVFECSGLGVDSTAQIGSFEIKKISYGNNNTVTSVWLTFELYADANSPAIFRGELKWKANLNPISVNRPPGATILLPPGSHPTGQPMPLIGLAADDDLPQPHTLRPSWRMVSGPWPVEFGAVDQWETTATFHLPGSYVLRLTVSDGLLETIVNRTVTVFDATGEVSLRLLSEPGDSVGAGINRTFTRENAQVSITTSDIRKNQVEVAFKNIDGSDLAWTVVVSLPSGSVLEPGFYPEVALSSIGYGTSVSQRTIGVRPNDLSASLTGTGSLAIRELRRDTAGAISALWLTFTQQCVNDAGPLTGELRYYAHRNLPAVDQPPFANAGVDQVGDEVQRATLRGRVADDILLGSALPVTWSKVSGPGEVSFAEPHGVVTAVAFSVPGTYVLRLTANDGARQGHDEVTVTSRADETSLRLRLEQGNAALEERSYGVVDGTFEVSYVSGRLRLSFVEKGTYYPTWWAAVTTPLERGLALGVAPVRLHGLTATRDLGVYDSSWTVEPNRDSMYEIRNLVQDATGAIVSCWVGLTIRDFSRTLTVDFCYRAKRDAAPHITFPTPRQYTFGPGTTVVAKIDTDGVPNDAPPTIAWSAPEDPGVQFVAPAEAATEVFFPRPGVYRLRVTALDHGLVAWREMEVHVAPRGVQWSGLVTLPDREERAYLDFKDTGSGTFSGVLRVGVQRIPFSGSFDGADHAQATFTYQKKPAQISFRPGENGWLDATIWIGGSLSTTPLLYHRAVDVTTVPAYLFGDYALMLHRPATEETVKFGAGWGRLTLRKNGAVSVLAVLPDGSRASGSVPFDFIGTFAIVLAPAHRQNWLSLEMGVNSATQTWEGRSHWVRRGTAGKPAIEKDFLAYATSPAELSRYSNPLNSSDGGVRALIMVTLPGEGPIHVPLTVGKLGRTYGVGGGRIAATCTFRKHGIFSGVIVHPLTRQLIRYSGIVIPGLNFGSGFAISGNKSGLAALVWE